MKNRPQYIIGTKHKEQTSLYKWKQRWRKEDWFIYVEPSMKNRLAYIC